MPLTQAPPDHALPAPGCEPGDVRLIPDFVDDRTADALLTAVLGCRRDGEAAPTPTTPGWTRAAGRAVRSYGGAVLGSTLVPAPLPAWAISLFDRLVADAGGAGGAGVDFSDDGGDDGGKTKKQQPPAASVRPNHVLANAYPAGVGILAHTDGPAYAPVAAILSLGEDSPGVMRFFRAGATSPAPTPAFSAFLPPRSLLVFRGQAYTDHLHGLADVEADVVDGSVLNADTARAWVDGKLGGGGGGGGGGAATATTIPRGPCRVSLTVRRVKKVKQGLLRL